MSLFLLVAYGHKQGPRRLAPMAAKTTTASEVWFGEALGPGKVPVKKNLFEEVLHATGTLELEPVFPCLDNGAIVPCLSVSLGKAGTHSGFSFSTPGPQW